MTVRLDPDLQALYDREESQLDDHHKAMLRTLMEAQQQRRNEELTSPRLRMLQEGITRLKAKEAEERRRSGELKAEKLLSDPKIRKLLALALTAGEEEANAALAKARSLYQGTGEE